MKAQLKKRHDGTETLERLKRWPSLRRALGGSRVRIFSEEHGAYWRANGAGYTTDGLHAGVYAFEDAWQRTNHCDPSKRITFLPANDPDQGRRDNDSQKP